MRLKLGRARYINCEPVYYALEHGIVPAECEIHDGTPAELNQRLRSGDLDVSVISAMEAALRPEMYRLLPDLAIACDGPVESVILASKRPVDELDGLPVTLSRHSLTSVYLVRLLLEKAYHVRPRFVAEAEAAEAVACLTIGDEALRLGRQYRNSLDLGKAWHALTGLPFVFAVWAVRAARSGRRERRMYACSTRRSWMQRCTPVLILKRWSLWPASGPGFRRRRAGGIFASGSVSISVRGTWRGCAPSCSTWPTPVSCRQFPL